jgi:hypothetical protein
VSNHTNEQEQDTAPISMPVRQFNPNEHLISLKSREGLKDYLPVQWRLVWFRSACPQGTIDTEEIEVDLDREVSEEAFVWNNETRRSEKVMKRAKGYARFRAVITDGKGGRATGTKSENAASFPDFIEKAETGAIGRALAALGYGTQFAPDLDEAHRIVDSPISNQNSGSNGNNHAPERPIPTPSATTRPVTTNGAANANRGQNTTAERHTDGELPAMATEQQLASIRKLSEHLGKAVPEEPSLSFLGAKKIIQQLTTEYRGLKQSSKAS